MLTENTRKYRQKREARLPVVAELYKKGYSLRKMKDEIDARFDSNVSINTLRKDIEYLLAEWRESRIQDTDDLITLELARIDDCLSELWEQWEKSKENYTMTESSRKGIPVPAGDGDGNHNGEQVEIQTVERKQKEQQIVVYGNPAYMSEIRQQLVERRKLLGLYAPEKKELSGKVTTRVEDMSNEEIQYELARIRAAREVKR